MDKEVVHVPGFSDIMPVPLSAAIKANGFVFVSGLPPIDIETGGFPPRSIEEQTRVVLDYLKLTLETAGSSLEKVVMVKVYCSNAGYFDQINKIYQTYFPKAPPARTFVTVGSWPAAFDVEMECIALA
jgi:2-iminobutanoate/2-iminopropanoate deaminase